MKLATGGYANSEFDPWLCTKRYFCKILSKDQIYEIKFLSPRYRIGVDIDQERNIRRMWLKNFSPQLFPSHDDFQRASVNKEEARGLLATRH